MMRESMLCGLVGLAIAGSLAGCTTATPNQPYRAESGKPDNGLRIANKTGSLSGFRADMALVEWPGVRYVIGIAVDKDPDTRFSVENPGAQLVGRLSRRVFEHFGGGALETA